MLARLKKFPEVPFFFLISCKQHLFVKASQLIHVPHHFITIASTEGTPCQNQESFAKTRKVKPIPKFAF